MSLEIENVSIRIKSSSKTITHSIGLQPFSPMLYDPWKPTKPCWLTSQQPEPQRSKGREYAKVVTAPKIAFEVARRHGKSVEYIAEAPSVEELEGKVSPEKAIAVAVVA